MAALAEMKALSDEISRLVGMRRLQPVSVHLDPELIVAWQSAKHVVSGPQPKETVATPLPPAGIEKPAA